MKIMFKIVFLLITVFNVMAVESMRDCVVLPVTDNVQGSLGYKLTDTLESMLKESDWCQLKPNSNILNILNKYQKDLDKHLENKEVLKLVGEKTKAGSLIKVHLIAQGEAILTELEIYSSNGEDLLFKKQETINTKDLYIVAQTVSNWLVEYGRQIPYVSTVTGVLGDQFTLDRGRIFGLFNDEEVEIYRVNNKKNHPLSQEVVDWDLVKIADAKVVQATDLQSQGVATKYESRKKINIGDWVVIVKKEKNNPVVKYDPTTQPEEKPDFGRTGRVGLYFNLGNSGLANDYGQQKKATATLLGGEVNVEIWLTRFYYVNIDLSKMFAVYRKDDGIFDKNNNTGTASYTKIVAGYKYLPMGFFWGPQINLYAGYGRYNYDLETSVVDGVTEFTFSGYMFGTRGDMPILKDFRGFVDFNFLLLFKKYNERTLIYGENDSLNNYQLKAGLTYSYDQTISLEGSIGMNSNKAKFESPKREVGFTDTIYQIGTVITF